MTLSPLKRCMSTMKRSLFCLLFLSARLLLAQSPLEKQASGDASYLYDLYLYLHQHPELSFYETETAKRMAAELKQAGFAVTEHVGGNGIVGVLSNGNGPVVLVRTDIDALPVKEETGKPYASTVQATDESGATVDVMHACGHDVHMTSWVGAARALAKMKDQWKGTVVFIGQPAEERNGGAKAMLDDGLYTRFPKPDYGIALHVSPVIEAGKVGVRPEYAFAFVDFMDITVHGFGGHGAYPHTTIDPVLLAARIIVDLQTIVSREISPLQPAVVTVGSIHGGTKGNIIPNEVKLELTMRSYSDDVRNAIIEKIRRICAGVAMSAGLPEDQYPECKLKNEYCPSVYNEPALTERLAGIFRKTLGQDKVVLADPVMAGEDFSYYGRTDDKIPTCQFWLGVVEKEKIEAAARGALTLPSLHSSLFAPDPKPSIRTGVISLTAAVMDLLRK